MLVDRPTNLLNVGAKEQTNTAGCLCGTQPAQALPLPNTLSGDAEDAGGFRSQDEVGRRS